ncbi:MAG: cyclophilin family peptidyl-prolyl cis-trans isomerase [Candidatus Azotimanducaceae bacterium]
MALAAISNQGAKGVMTQGVKMNRWLSCVLLLAMAVCASGTANAANPVVEMHTTAGVIVLELNQYMAPVTVANFLSYVEKDGYAGTIFHRVIPGFMIQSGGHYEDFSELEGGEPIVNEADNGLKNKTGTIAMARIDVIDSSERQFFINASNNAELDHSQRSCTRKDEAKVAAALERGLRRPQTCGSFGYAVFGRVTQGMDVVRKIERQPTRPKGMHQNVPVVAVVIEKVILRETAS